MPHPEGAPLYGLLSSHGFEGVKKSLISGFAAAPLDVRKACQAVNFLKDFS
jgi:hypothetical protein